MDDLSRVLLEGYVFKVKDFYCQNDTTTVTVSVCGSGAGVPALQSWVLELQGADEAGIISCEKRTDGGVWLPAAAQKTTYELTGDIGISGVLVQERVDGETIEFRITLNTPLAPWMASVAFISDDTIYQSIDRMRIGEAPKEPVRNTPIEKTFCLYVVLPQGYQPAGGACRAHVSITKRGLFVVSEALADETGGFAILLIGSVKVTASVPLENDEASGDMVQAAACDCFEVCETIGWADVRDAVQMPSVSICPQKDSFDLTLLNAHCDRSVYRLDGSYVIDIRRQTP